MVGLRYRTADGTFTLPDDIDLIHLVQARTRLPGATVSHCKFGCKRRMVACME